MNLEIVDLRIDAYTIPRIGYALEPKPEGWSDTGHTIAAPNLHTLIIRAEIRKPDWPLETSAYHKWMYPDETEDDRWKQRDESWGVLMHRRCDEMVGVIEQRADPCSGVVPLKHLSLSRNLVLAGHEERYRRIVGTLDILD